MRRMRTTVKKTISLIAAIELLILLGGIFSFEFFINMQIASLSSFFIILGSMIAHKRLINNRLKTENIDEKRDLLDEIEDPHELYEEQPSIDENSELDIKAIIKEEKKKIKTFSLKDIKKGSSAGFSPFRVAPYLFLILGFIALKNNDLLNISVYLPSLLIGIAAAYMSFKSIYLSKTLP